MVQPPVSDGIPTEVIYNNKLINLIHTLIIELLIKISVATHNDSSAVNKSIFNLICRNKK